MDTISHHNITPIAILSWLYNKQFPLLPQDPSKKIKHELSIAQPTKNGPGMVPERTSKNVEIIHIELIICI